MKVLPDHYFAFLLTFLTYAKKLVLAIVQLLQKLICLSYEFKFPVLEDCGVRRLRKFGSSRNLTKTSGTMSLRTYLTHVEEIVSSYLCLCHNIG